MTGWTPEACRLSGTLASEIRAQERREKMRVASRRVELCPDCYVPLDECNCEVARRERKADQEYDAKKNGDYEDFYAKYGGLP